MMLLVHQDGVLVRTRMMWWIVVPGWPVGRPRMGPELCIASCLSGFGLAKVGNRGVLKFGP